MALKIAIIGASGRMGRELINVISYEKDMVLSAAVDRFGNPNIGLSALSLAGIGSGGPSIVSDIDAASQSDVIIDFSGAEGTASNIENYRKFKKAVVIGSTGLSQQEIDRVKSLASDIPVLMSSNMSTGVNLVSKLVEIAAKVLDNSFDIEVFEAHHRYKKDAPSGTAITLGKSAALGRGVDFNEKAVTCREGERTEASIGFSSIRGGDIVGDHTVFFCGDGERVEITHKASSRALFSKGAVRAARWLSDKPAGFYTINDVLGLNINM